MAWQIYEFVDERQRGVIEDWLRREKIQKKARILLNQKIHFLGAYGPDLPPQLLAGPIDGLPIYKLKVRARGVQLRPMLCRGPVDNDREYTLLLGAVEKDGKLIPEDAPQRANANRTVLVANPSRRRVHENDF